MRTIVEQLNEIYWTKEHWQSHKETPAGITNYHQAMVDNGNIQTYLEDGELLGYFELWRVTSEQLPYVLQEDFIAPFENTATGGIAYLANLWIVNDDRKKRVFKNLYMKFLNMVDGCDVIVGNEVKRNSRLRIFMVRR